MGLILAFVVGLILGILGGGGSILTLPILVYFFDVQPILATSYSLFIVGISALIATQRFIVKKQVSYKIGIWFAIPSLIGVYFSRQWILPNIPNSIFTIGDFALSKDIFLLCFFAIIMLLAGLSMIFVKRTKLKPINTINYFGVIIDGLVVGVVTGLVGAGGGFLIVPALVLLAGLDIRKAIGTSLMIIALKSIIGFLGDTSLEKDWVLLLSFTLISSIGILVGIFFAKYIEGKNLKSIFGVFVILMSLFILVKELFL
ncbi:MAG: sulfite exporter TauE/SafE family protein [Flavobacteriales bacterium]